MELNHFFFLPNFFFNLSVVVLQQLESPALLGEVNTSARLTCLAVWKPSSVPPAFTEEPAETAATSDGDFPAILDLTSHVNNIK